MSDIFLGLLSSASIWYLSSLSSCTTLQFLVLNLNLAVIISVNYHDASLRHYWVPARLDHSISLWAFTLFIFYYNLFYLSLKFGWFQGCSYFIISNFINIDWIIIYIILNFKYGEHINLDCRWQHWWVWSVEDGLWKGSLDIVMEKEALSEGV